MTTEKDLWPEKEKESLTYYKRTQWLGKWSFFLSKVENSAFWSNKLKEMIGVRERVCLNLAADNGNQASAHFITPCLTFLGHPP